MQMKKLLNEDQIDQILDLLTLSIPKGEVRDHFITHAWDNRDYFFAGQHSDMKITMSPATLRQQLLMVFDECKFSGFATLAALKKETLYWTNEAPNAHTLMGYYVGKMVREAFA